jgi:threonine/homoserine/homoserine lactone efflux protein
MLHLFILIGISNLLGAMSPGPDFVIVVSNTLAGGRKAGIATAWGIGTAITIHVFVYLMGLTLLFHHWPLGGVIIRWIGALYILYLGLRITFSKSHAMQINHNQQRVYLPAKTAYKRGFLICITNPKVMAFFLALFSSALTTVTWTMMIGFMIECCLVAGIWFTILATLLTQTHIEAWLKKYGHLITKFLGLYLCAFAILLGFLPSII